MNETIGDMMLAELHRIRRELETHCKLLKRVKIAADVWLTIIILTLLPLVLVVVLLAARWVLVAAGH